MHGQWSSDKVGHVMAIFYRVDDGEWMLTGIMNCR
jgi:hypothetical protein